jgi:SOS response regulatory protein OraA/RecX
VRGFDEAATAEALATLVRTGILDDTRYAENRAHSLAERGAGDAFIRHDLAAAGVASAGIESALEGIESEHERARRIVDRRGASARTARYLAGKGFAEDVVRAAVAHSADEGLG